MTTLNRYILREIFGFFLISLITFTGILFTIRILKFANLIINKGVEVGQVLKVFLAIIPTFLEIAVPMATLLGIMMAFARLSGDSEIIVIRASGISLRELIKPVISFAIIIVLMSLVVSGKLRPWGFRSLSDTFFEIAKTRSTSGLNEGVFNKLGPLTLYAEKIDYGSGKMESVLVDDRRNEEGRQIITAKDGKILSDQKNQTINIHLYTGEIHEKGFEKYSITDFQTNTLALHPDELYETGEKKRRRFREMSGIELRNELEEYRELLKTAKPQELIDAERKKEKESIEKQGEEFSAEELSQRIQGIKLEKGRRTSMPFAALVLALCAFPLGIQSPRTQKTWGVGLSMTLGMILFFLYYGVLSIGVALSEAGYIHHLIALWAPNFLILGFALYALSHMRSERWQSIGEAFQHAIQFFIVKFQEKKKQ